jgi:hypothetical protein
MMIVIWDVPAAWYSAACSVTASGLTGALRQLALLLRLRRLAVAVSLEILFGKYTEKICRDPP